MRNDERHFNSMPMEEILKAHGPDRKEIIPILHAVQSKYGYIPPEAVVKIAGYVKISEAEVFGVLTFYKAFSLIPRGEFVITVCLGTACHVRGGARIADELERKIGIKRGNTTADGKFSLETVNCLGCCAIGPVVVVNGIYHSRVSIQNIDAILADCRSLK